MPDAHDQPLPAVYILTNKKDGCLYVGSTTDIRRRTNEHKDRFYPKSFSAHCHTLKLVYYEFHSGLKEARAREKRMKWWHRAWKIRLIEEKNPKWRDLSAEVDVWTR